MGRARDEGATPPSEIPYKVFACPNKCGRIEKGGKPPFYSSCPSCFKPAGRFVEVDEPPVQIAEPSKEELGAALQALAGQLHASLEREAQLQAELEAQRKPAEPVA